MWIYEPCVPAGTGRLPTVILAPGGGFAADISNAGQGTKFGVIAQEYVRRGYVVAIMEYRTFHTQQKNCCPCTAPSPSLCWLRYVEFVSRGDSICDPGTCEYVAGPGGPNTVNRDIHEMMYKTAQDGQAANVYLKQNYFDHNIDTNNIFIGGTSGGATMAINAAYYNINDRNPNWNGYTTWGA